MIGLTSRPTTEQSPLDHTHNNNFDLIRLLAAVQVAIVHICEHLRIDGGPLLSLLQLFPGVPVFFFVSGFLVSRSLERSVDLQSFARKRLLRIYPAILVCFVVSLFLASLFRNLPWTTPAFATWIVAQVTIAQFYNPDFLRNFGTGVLNGSLWTIPVELQFYAALPIVYAAAKRFGSLAFYSITLIALAGHTLFLTHLYGAHHLYAKIIQVTVLPWLGLFMVGVLAQRQWPHIRPWFSGRAFMWFCAYCLVEAVLALRGITIGGNAINAISALMLFAVVLAACYTRPMIAHRLLRGNDISYGIYLYHAPILNTVLELQSNGHSFGGAVPTAFLILAATAASAIASWVLIERPLLRLKRQDGVNTPNFSAHASALGTKRSNE
jgi:peptidoglycan/LPS O-acetylase OafA/YrhL